MLAGVSLRSVRDNWSGRYVHKDEERENLRVEDVGKRRHDWVITLESAIVNG